MRRYVSIILLIAISLSFVPGSFAETKEPIKIYIDGEERNFGAPPVERPGTIMVPFRGIFEALGAEVGWNGTSRMVTGSKDDITIYLQLDNNDAMISKLDESYGINNSHTMYLPVAPFAINGSTYVPIRFIAETLGADVNWDGKTRTVSISSPKEELYLGLTRRNFIERLSIRLDMDVEEVLAHEIFNSYARKNLSDLVPKKEMELNFIRVLSDVKLGKKLNLDMEVVSVPESLGEKVIQAMIDKVNTPFEELNGFYAIQSYHQIDLIDDMTSVAFGWSRVEFDKDGNVNLEMGAGNEYKLALGQFSEPINRVKDNKATTHLMVIADEDTKNSDGVGLVSAIIGDVESRERVISQIIEKLNETSRDNQKVSFDGVVIDFEHLISKDLAQDFNIFLKELKECLVKNEKQLIVAVQPSKYFKGYDYKVIGEVADRVILMAHDYDARRVRDLNLSDPIEGFHNIKTPLAPIDNPYNRDFDLYGALKAITDEATGISDKSKIWLQVSFASAQWWRDSQMNIGKSKPNYTTIRNRLLNEETKDSLTMNYDITSQHPYYTFRNPSNETDYVVWYEDSRSILAKLNLAKLFGLKGISVWRLGNIPNYIEDDEAFMYLDVWNTILSQY